MQIEFDWDPAKAASNARKHGVRFENVMVVFDDPLAKSILYRSPDIAEERWITMGEDRSGSVFVVVHIYEDVDSKLARVRIISARRASKAEARQYREDDLR